MDMSHSDGVETAGSGLRAWSAELLHRFVLDDPQAGHSNIILAKRLSADENPT
jgi:hypothetical protein